MTPLHVGVLMAVYKNDDPAAFERALCSVLEQRFDEPVDVHVYLGVDGPIGPALEAILSRHASRLHLVLRNANGRGLAVTLNRLIDARGDEAFYFRMDADDFSLPERFQAQIDYMRIRPDISIVGTAITEIDTETGRRSVVHYCDEPERARAYICRRVPVAHPTVCFRREVFEAISRYPTERGNEDVAMWFACLKRGFSIGNLTVPLLEFSVNPTFWQRRGVAKAWGEYKCYARGIFSLWGPSWRLVFPLLRLALRMMPTQFARLAYRLRADTRD